LTDKKELDLQITDVQENARENLERIRNVEALQEKWMKNETELIRSVRKLETALDSG
jgi:hypothetical protein